MNILHVITGTPAWVWVLFGYLLFSGIQAIKSYVVPVWKLAIMPAIFMTWSLYGILSKSNFNILLLSYWCMAVVIGRFVGYKIFSRMNFYIDAQTKLVYMPGTYSNLMLSMSFFLIKYAINVIYAVYPIMKLNIYLTSFDVIVSALISGIFLSRLIIVIDRYCTQK
ncbi:hypothetical protein KBC04_04195 [Candidatus Babeliales bacterium]|nr:hypothetical protein [Candidatus Babeliales bacterium]MBP9844267.1 hypothetical protein [Candidatus Babeliales bacterium]